MAHDIGQKLLAANRLQGMVGQVISLRIGLPDEQVGRHAVQTQTQPLNIIKADMPLLIVQQADGNLLGDASFHQLGAGFFDAANMKQVPQIGSEHKRRFV